MPITLTLERDVPEGVQVLGVPVFAGEHAGPGAVFDAAFLAERGFEGKLEETLAVPGEDGTTIIAVGMGERASLDEEGLRRAAAALVKAAWRDEVVATT
ncbi:MAG: leucyl aminopeptidase, partial [Acidimicrobiia bacterium]